MQADVLAIDTDTRRLAPAEAARRSAAAWQALRAPGRRLYKKIDSTLRGNWAAEVAALQPLAGLAIVAPAFPATGRTLRGGRVFVHGTPLESTETWQLEHRERLADVPAMLSAAGLRTAQLEVAALRGEPAALARQIAAAGARGVQALSIDAQTSEDLALLARVTAALDEALFWVGSGGLARELALLPGQFAAAPRTPANAAPRRAAQTPILVLVGSLSAVSQQQCALLCERAALDELVVPPALLRQGPRHADWAAWQGRLGACLAAGTDLLLRIGRDDAFDAAQGEQLCAALAQLVAPHFAKLGGLVATGGETARAMLSAAGIGSLLLLADLEAGVAVSRPLAGSRQAQPAPGPVIITKAGAFGTEHALYAAWRHLRNMEAEFDTASRAAD
jgi:uncharacterized protein YgbK (DUF1537 family)